jgi:hypothetical protein
MVYNRATGQTRAIPSATAQSWGGTALAGDLLFWGGYQVRYRHLDTDADGVVINARASVRGVYGNTLLWTDENGIWGAHLPDLLPTRLVAGSGPAAPRHPCALTARTAALSLGAMHKTKTKDAGGLGGAAGSVRTRDRPWLLCYSRCFNPASVAALRHH